MWQVAVESTSQVLGQRLVFSKCMKSTRLPTDLLYVEAGSESIVRLVHRAFAKLYRFLSKGTQPRTIVTVKPERVIERPRDYWLQNERLDCLTGAVIADELAGKEVQAPVSAVTSFAHRYRRMLRPGQHEVTLK